VGVWISDYAYVSIEGMDMATIGDARRKNGGKMATGWKWVK